MRAASSLGKLPFVLIALRSCRFKASIAFVVYTIRRTSGGTQERDHMLPGVQPPLGDYREPGAPFLVEGLELGLGVSALIAV